MSYVAHLVDRLIDEAIKILEDDSDGHLVSRKAAVDLA
jgi:hypothetical protein